MQLEEVALFQSISPTGALAIGEWQLQGTRENSAAKPLYSVMCKARHVPVCLLWLCDFIHYQLNNQVHSEQEIVPFHMADINYSDYTAVNNTLKSVQIFHY